MQNGKFFLPLTSLINPPSALSTGTCSFRLPSGIRLHEMIWKVTLPAGKLVGDCFERIMLRIGTEEVRNLTITQHDDLLSLDGPSQGIQNNVAGAVAFVPVPFTEHVRDNSVEREDFALDIPEGLVVYADLKQNSLATQATLEALIVAEPLADIAPQNRNFDGRGLPKLSKHKATTPVSGGLNNDFEALIPALLKDRLQSMHLYNPGTSNSKITRVAMKLDGEKFDLYKEDIDVILTRGGLFPRAGIFDIVPDFIGKNSDAWIMDQVRNLAMRVYYADAASGTVDVVTKSYGSI